MAEEEEVRMEVEAMQAVYGDDCTVIEGFPPHLRVHIKPRTADDSTQQFVEVTLGIKSGDKYPMDPPHVYIIEEKGLDEQRRTHLLTSIQNKAQELSSCLMLVALCEEAVELLSNMNHPDGDCPLCLYPLVAEDSFDISFTFMKLMSCYHCFHSECIIRWWKWIQEQNEKKNMEENSAGFTRSHGVTDTDVNQHEGACPVCRKVFDPRDIERVLDYLGAELSQVTFAGTEAEEDMKVYLQSVSEHNRREQFEAISKLQQENSGLIEPKKDLLILPGMFLPENPTLPATSPEIINEQCHVDVDNLVSTMNHNPNNDNPSNGPAASKPRNHGTNRRSRAYTSKRQPHAQSSRRQWIRKEEGTSQQ